ncbi:MAG TPA: Rossmann-like and DUF2520 domain-containing protein [Terriglobales bacterium]|nr:Rossmann-like and DUF2520 domain-containing protein [Terriglobales bacterium]
MRKKLKFAVVGAGRLGTALAWALHANGYDISEIVTRGGAPSFRRARQIARQLGAKAVNTGTPLTADITWICVPDDAIRSCAAILAGTQDWSGKVVFHASGALSSDELSALSARGAAVASVHPMMSFVSGVAPDLAGVTFAVEGDAAAVRFARRIVRDLKANALAIRKSDKVLYHAWGAFGSPLIVAELAAAECVAAAIGISSKQARKTLAPMLRRTIENYIQHGAAAAFSGPIVRGDVETVSRHVRALKKVPQAREVYLILARAALKDLPAMNRRGLEKVIGRL